ncbi:unnamed protein product [Blepharisma stoltei]|uniref:t-SNARE coiled-coil homology domain-containing protein n=1 Tax=Blepharisma stoltei TaxID=1481888 RepID=A0AAU9JFQ5_9CILI|nr:unnamed protein product [Blepharisma stoltei]
MEDFQHYSDSSSKRLDRLEGNIKKLEDAPVPSVPRIITECDNEIKRIRNDFEACEQAISECDGPDRQECKKKLAELNDRFDRCRAELEFKRQSGSQKALFGNALEIDGPKQEAKQNLSQMSAQQVISRGDVLYQEAEERMQRAFGVTEQSKQVAGAIEVELNQQEQQIGRVEDKTQDLRGHLRRANKIMDQIYRRYLTDKCILCLIICVMIVLVVIIIYGAVGGKDLGSPSDSVK